MQFMKKVNSTRIFQDLKDMQLFFTEAVLNLFPLKAARPKGKTTDVRGSAA